MKLRNVFRRTAIVLAAAMLIVPVFAGVAFADATVPDLAPVAVQVTGVGTFSFNATPTITATADGFVVDAAAVRAWVVSTLAPATYIRPVNSTRTVSKYHGISITPSVIGRHLNVEAAVAAISAEILSEANGGTPQTVVLTPVTDVPRYLDSRWGRCIVVVLHERKLYLYNGRRLEKKYRVAIGQKRYPTPKGTWRVVRKVKNPSWHNPGSAWARSMPSYIGPGPSNPLGTRALYLNASGIRIHGTNKINSIGTPASHGCVRMLRRDIEKLYPKIAVGTTVYIQK